MFSLVAGGSLLVAWWDRPCIVGRRRLGHAGFVSLVSDRKLVNVGDG
jgi:hypothetical protein